MQALENAYAIIIGVGDDLPETVNDANLIKNILTDKSIAGYPEENVVLLTGEEANRDNIIGAFDDLIEKVRQKENSTVFLYYSGHGGYYIDDIKEEIDGEMVPMRREINGKMETLQHPVYWFQLFGLRNSDEMEFEEQVKRMFYAEELLEKLNALETNSLVFFLDCCHAAGMTKGSLTLGSPSDNPFDENQEHESEFKNLEGLAVKLDNEKGISIISACREDQQSFIDRPNGAVNSLFTECLSNYISAKHDPDFKLPFIYIQELTGFLQREVPRLAWEKLQERQNPFANIRNEDNFAICYAPKFVRDRLDGTSAPRQTVSEPSTPKGKDSKPVTAWRQDGTDNLILFLHGFSGEASDTFGNIPRFMLEDEDIKGWDMKPIGYSQFMDPEMGKEIWAGIFDIDRMVDNLVAQIKYKFNTYSRIAIIAHSLGGLVAQKAILKLGDKFRNRISHLIMFGTPSNGIDASMLEKDWNKKYQEMSSEGEFISALRKTWSETIGEKPAFKLKVAASISDEYVPIESAFMPFNDESCVMIDGDHLRMVKPESPESAAYELIVKTLTDSEFANKYLNKEEINLALGRYGAVVQDMLPKVKDLSEEGLRQLIFALEGLDRREEALEILNTHELARNNSDLLGIIGGRHKRAYLLHNLKKDGEAAITYYQKALDIAKEKEDLDQIYYLAINLAFTSIVINDDSEKMREFAHMAKDAATKCADSLWRVATLAEANMYLENYSESMEQYQEAASVANIRQKISMHTNAYAGYTALTKINDPDDQFISFLKTHFLK